MTAGMALMQTTWLCCRQCIYEYGDHGGLLLLASHETEGPTDRLQFSLDQGACWHNIMLAEAIDIQNIRCSCCC